MTDTIQQVEDKVRAYLANDSSGHDWWHIHRVVQMALRISKAYPEANREVIHLSALLHDIGDYKLHDGDEGKGRVVLDNLIDEVIQETELKEHIKQIIREVSFRGGITKKTPGSLEGKIVQDADRLDAIGAIGIARAFAFGGANNRLLHNPSTAPQVFASEEEYKQAKGTTINHFYEKLLKLPKNMNTPIAQQIARERLAYMEEFLKTFLAEWNGG